jgi:hypothetical protein
LGYRAALKRGGFAKHTATCTDCQREDRFAFDLACLAGYARPRPFHRKCIARFMAQSKSIQSGAYAEALLAEFDQAIAEIQAVIDECRTQPDKKVFFQAVESKREMLEAKAKALGFGAVPGRPGKNDSPAIPDDVSREDLGKIAEAYLKSREAPPPAPVEAAVEEDSEVGVGSEQLVIQVDAGADEVAVMDEQGTSLTD